MWVEVYSMQGHDQIARTKLLPPRIKNPLLTRNRLLAKLAGAEELPVTLVHSGPGFGKSTLLADFCRRHRRPCCWYSLAVEDRDIYRFFRSLIYAFRTCLPGVGRQAMELLPKLKQDPSAWLRPLELLANDLLDVLKEDMCLVFDDYHILGEDQQINVLLEKFVEIMPVNLHIIISTREVPHMERLLNWRVQGSILEIRPDDLVLSRKEVEEFFAGQSKRSLTPQELEAVYEGTEGWILALQLVLQSLKKGQSPADIFKQPRRSLPILFDYLVQVVLQGQKPHIQDFLLKTAPLQVLEEEACNYLADSRDSGQILRELVEHGLFTVEMDQKRMYYHPLFKRVLERKLQEDTTFWREHNLRAAHYFQDQGRLEEAVSHLIKGGETLGAARLMAQNIKYFQKEGSSALLDEWLHALSANVLREFPRLILFWGDLKRHTSRYNEALRLYTRALDIFNNRNDKRGMILAYQKLAMVYLDTVEPVRAEEYIMEALAIQERDQLMEETTLLRLLAENKANQGTPREAAELIQACEHLDREARSSRQEQHLETRMLLRRGRLKEARRLLEKMVVCEGDRKREPRTHRESPLVLSLVYAFLGEDELARSWAHKGLELAHRLNSPFTEAVGYMRLGHGLQLRPFMDEEKVIAAYKRGLSLMDNIQVVRGRAEALWGMTLAYSHTGNPVRALPLGEECSHISLEAGDEWLAHLGKMGLGISYFHAGQMEQSYEIFSRTQAFFNSINDLQGTALSHLWLSLILFKQREPAWLEEFKPFLKLACQEEYQNIWLKPTLMGPRDPMMVKPLLLEFIKETADNELKQWVAGTLGMERKDYHPGYTLYIRALGPLRVARGAEDLNDGDWKREKARELFMLFLAHRHQLLPREQIFERLWPGQGQETAGRDFKVALNALNTALEPERRARTTPFFIKRVGQAYGLDPDASWCLDVDFFAMLIREGLTEDKPNAERRELLAEGLALYRGDFLAFFLYHDWLREERESLRRLFFQGSEVLAGIYLQEGQAEQALDVSERMLEVDNCWETAYQTAMESYLQMGNRYLAQKMYLLCAQTLAAELGVEPLPATQDYLHRVFCPVEVRRILKELDLEGGVQDSEN